MWYLLYLHHWPPLFILFSKNIRQQKRKQFWVLNFLLSFFKSPFIKQKEVPDDYQIIDKQIIEQLDRIV